MKNTDGTLLEKHYKIYFDDVTVEIGPDTEDTIYISSSIHGSPDARGRITLDYPVVKRVSEVLSEMLSKRNSDTIPEGPIPRGLK